MKLKERYFKKVFEIAYNIVIMNVNICFDFILIDDCRQILDWYLKVSKIKIRPEHRDLRVFNHFVDFIWNGIWTGFCGDHIPRAVTRIRWKSFGTWVSKFGFWCYQMIIITSLVSIIRVNSITKYPPCWGIYLQRWVRLVQLLFWVGLRWWWAKLLWRGLERIHGSFRIDFWNLVKIMFESIVSNLLCVCFLYFL